MSGDKAEMEGIEERYEISRRCYLSRFGESLGGYNLTQFTDLVKPLFRAACSLYSPELRSGGPVRNASSASEQGSSAFSSFSRPLSGGLVPSAFSGSAFQQARRDTFAESAEQPRSQPSFGSTDPGYARIKQKRLPKEP